MKQHKTKCHSTLHKDDVLIDISIYSKPTIELPSLLSPLVE